MSGSLQQTSSAVVGRSSSFDGLSKSGGARQLDGCGGAGEVVFDSADFAADGDPLARNDDFVHDVAEPGFSADADMGGGLGYGNNDVGPNVPGAKASTVRIHALWHSLIRDIQAGATPFAIFFQTMLRKPLVPIKKAPTISTWPMPLPFSKYEDCDLVSNNEVGFRKLLNLQIGYLNYLHLGRPAAAPHYVCRGAKLNDLQRAVVSRLERLCGGWHAVPEVNAGEMGRVAAKQERQESVLSGLSNLASDAFGGLKKYGCRTRKVSLARPSGAAGKVVGRMARDETCGAQTIVASRLKMEGKPIFDPNPFLDDDTKHLYNNPFSMVPSDLSDLATPPRVMVHADFHEKIALLHLLEESDRLSFRGKNDIIEGYGNGLFCVPKNTTTDRLILDGRPANLLQTPPGKFILSMASASTLCGMYLSKGEKLLMSGDDLSNFFYTFKVNDERVSRNFLHWKIPVDIAKTFKSFPERLQEEDFVYACLCTLAMGDSAACDYAQTAHLSMGLQAGCFTPEQLITLHGRVPRNNLVAGIIIDDFILLERVAMNATSGLESATARRRMHDMYQRVGLEAHPTKGFADEESAEFWGASVDGLGGLVRANIRRAISLVWVTSQVAKMQVCSVGLLEVLAGGFVSLFCFRRRLMALLDLVYVMQAGRDRQDVVRLCPAAVDELWSLVILAPLAVTDIRAGYADFIYMVDASNWGDAVVGSSLKGGISSEIHRHGAAKSAWTRLLSPFKSHLRGKGCLDPQDELPEGDVMYSEHPVWEVAARGLNYSLAWKAKAKDGRRINIGELRSYLKAESLGAERCCDVRIPIGSDSQVSIGAVCKGRSASGALNAKLRQSLPVMLGCGIYSTPGYIGSARNPSDDPTRGQKLRTADVDLPHWWVAAVGGDFGPLDIFLTELKLHPHQLAGYKDLGEIGIINPQSFDPSLKTGLNKFHRKVRADVRLRAHLKLRANSSTDDNPTSSFFPQEVLDCLASFGLEQFIFQKGKQWPPSQKGFLDLYSGKKGFAHAAVRYGAPWVLTVDFLDGPQCDLLDKSVRRKIEFLIDSGVFSHLSAAPICSSFSRAITPAVRDKLHPEGLPNVSPSMQQKIADGNSHSKWLCKLLEKCIQLHLLFWVENPDSSFLWQQKEWARLPNGAASRFYKCDYCTFKAPWRKRTRFVTNNRLAGQKRLCNRQHRHILLRGRARGNKACWTKLAEPYPKALCSVLAHAACSDLGLYDGPGSLTCKCSHRRIGEAANPGPRQKSTRPKDPFDLDNVELIRPETVALGRKQWDNFRTWSIEHIGLATFDKLLLAPGLLGSAMACYGKHWYGEGGPLSGFRHLLVYVQRTWPSTRGHLQEAWNVVSKWEELEPIEHRRPLPKAMIEAMCSLAMHWEWVRVTCVILIAFHACARPGEVLGAPRANLILPEDIDAESGSPCFLRISKPKPGRRGMGRVQHCKVNDASVSRFLSSVFSMVHGNEDIYPGSSASFRYRWNLLLRKMAVPSVALLTPGCLRASGTVELYRRGYHIMDILWCLRLKNLETLQHYLQEISTQITMIDLPARARFLILSLSKLFPHFLSIKRL